MTQSHIEAFTLKCLASQSDSLKDDLLFQGSMNVTTENETGLTSLFMNS